MLNKIIETTKDTLSAGFVCRTISRLSLVPVALMIATTNALASQTSTGMPWESPLKILQSSITGPVAYGVSLIGITATGGMLIFGGEVSEFTRRIMYVVLVAAILLGASSIMGTLFTTAAVL